MITQDNRNASSDSTDEKIRKLKELLNDDADADGNQSVVEECPQAVRNITVSGNGNIVSTGNSKVILLETRRKSDVLKTCLLCCLFF